MLRKVKKANSRTNMPYKLKRVKQLSEILRPLERPYNRPVIANAEEREAFCDEYEEYDKVIRSTLCQFGAISAFSGTEFSMGDTWGDSRKIGIVFDSDSVFKEIIIARLWEALQEMATSYLLVISGDVINKDFYILIDKDDEIVGYSKDPKILDAFGFPP